MRTLFGRAAATLAVVLVVDCGGPSGSESSSADGGSAGAVADEGAASDSDADRQVITTATASVVVEDPAGAA